MSEHIVKKHLEKYGKRELSSAERVKVILHLSKCEVCLREFQEMFPNITNPNREIILPSSEAATDEPFHLNFEEHFQPFVDNEISEIDREIVESHVKVCSFCAASLRDLQEFRQKLELQTIVAGQNQTGFWQKIAAFFDQNYKSLALAFGLVLTIGLGIMFWLKFPKGEETIAQNSPIPFEPPIKSENSNGADNVNQQITVETNKNSNKSENTNQQPKNAVESPKEVELANLVLPKFLNDLRIEETGTVRGSNDLPTQKIAVISPNGSVIRGSSPVLRWQNVPNIQSFEVSVFDNDFNPVAKIDSVSGNSWRVANLPKGKIYQWQVSAKSVAADGKATNFIGQSKFYIVSERDENRIKQAKDGLEKGKAFAEAGLLREAAGEFRRYLTENPNSETARKFLRQVEQGQR